ncbi:MAG: hypothetical protein OEX07_01985 [Gammaproteobacteria bacterium]|nr:hypothetical protein [Gammaproteobacteria bacterium]
MNNTYNYSFLFEDEANKPAQHFAFEKGGTVDVAVKAEPLVKKQNVFNVFLNSIYSNYFR